MKRLLTATALLMAVLFLLNLTAATQDIATDGLDMSVDVSQRMFTCSRLFRSPSSANRMVKMMLTAPRNNVFKGTTLPIRRQEQLTLDGKVVLFFRVDGDHSNVYHSIQVSGRKSSYQPGTGVSSLPLHLIQSPVRAH